MSDAYARVLQAPAAARWGALAAVLALIAFLGSRPQAGPVTGAAWWGYASNLAHQPLYAGLALAAAVATRTPLPAPAVRIGVLLGFAALVGVLDEWHQASAPERDSSLWDLGSDVLGAGVGLWLVARRRRPRGPWRPVWPLALVVMLCLAWNCVPAFGPPLPMPRPA